MSKASSATVLHALVIAALLTFVQGCGRTQEPQPTTAEPQQAEAVPADDEPGGPRDVVRTYYELLRGKDLERTADVLELPSVLEDKLRAVSPEERQTILRILVMAAAREDLRFGLNTTDIAPAEISGDSATVAVTLVAQTGETGTLVKTLHRIDGAWKIFIPGTENLPATLPATAAPGLRPERPPGQTP